VQSLSFRDVAPDLVEMRALAHLALPIIMAGMAEMAINATDVVMMGWLGADALAAGLVGAHFYYFNHFFGLGVLAAVAPLVAQALGARRRRNIRRVVRQGLWVATAIALPVTVIVWHADWALLRLGQDVEVARAAQSYLDTRVYGYLPSLWFLVLSHLLAAHSRPQAILVVSTVAVGINALGNYLLMFGHFGLPRMELAGAGLSSAVVDSFLAIGLAVYVLRSRPFKRYFIFYRFWRSDVARFLEIFKLGLPIAGTIMAEGGLFLAATLLIGGIGTAELAGHAVAVQCASIAYMVPYGLSQAATVRVGLAAGARSVKRVARSAATAMVAGCGFMLLPAFAFWLWAEPIASVYLDLDDPANADAIAFASSFLVVAAFFQLVDGAQSIAAGALRGIKDTQVPMWLAGLSYWLLGFGAAVGLSFYAGYGGEGVWAGLACGLGAAALFLNWRFVVMLRRLSVQYSGA
jgi:multidrug resistance protein, MATE family